MKYELKDKKIIVLGAGISGIAASLYAAEHQAEVTLYDAKSEDDLSPEAKALKQKGVKLLCGEKCPVCQNWDLAIKSPGISPDIPFICSMREKKIPIIGELELAFSISKIPYVAITGTNGKTTVTTLTYEMIAKSGIKALLGGNIGIPLIQQAEQAKDGVMVAEVSSFQLEDSPSFAPHIAVIMNITPDHLNRHGTMENYISVKRSILNNMGKDDYAVLNYDDETVRAFAEKAKCQTMFFSVKEKLEEGAYAENGVLKIACNGKIHELLPFSKMKIKGEHNLSNALASSMAAYLAGADTQSIKQVLADFKGVEHRQEQVCENNGVLYINDSKATNPDSAIKAIEAYDEPLILIAGGLDKKVSFTQMLEKGKEKIKALVLLGECAQQIKDEALALGIQADSIFMCATFEEAVNKAVFLASRGDIVLLSPACASWDMFKSYEERGRMFKKIVKEIIEKEIGYTEKK